MHIRRAVATDISAIFVMLKDMHNNIVNTALDGTQGVVPGESFMQQQLLKDLKDKIDQFCEE